MRAMIEVLYMICIDYLTWEVYALPRHQRVSCLRGSTSKARLKWSAPCANQRALQSELMSPSPVDELLTLSTAFSAAHKRPEQVVQLMNELRTVRAVVGDAQKRGFTKAQERNHDLVDPPCSPE